MFATLEDLPDGRTLLARVDLNSPVADGEVQDNRRFARHAETVAALTDRDHAVAVLAHQGRPGRDTFVSLDQHARILEAHLDAPVRFCPDTAGERAQSEVQDLEAGSVLVLENVRMVDAELADRTPDEHARSDFVRALSSVADAYIGDAYSAAHRAHASIVGFPQVMDAYAGVVMADEYTANSAIQSRTFDGPVRMVLGGTKADDLVRVMEGVADRVDDFLLGGIIGELCLRARGVDVGYDLGDESLFDPIWADHADDIRALLDRYDDRLHLPADLAYADAAGERAETSVDGIEKATSFLDIGGETIARYEEVLSGSDAVFVKGAVGMFEDERFSEGTCSLLRAVGDSGAFSVIGGGDTSRAIDLYDLDADAYSHVSIAGGAYVRALAGEPLPGVEALIEAADRIDD